MTQKNKIILVVVLVGAIIAAVVGYKILTAPDTRDANQKMRDAIEEMKTGVDKAARQLEDRTKGDKLKDALDDAVKDMKKSDDNK